MVFGCFQFSSLWVCNYSFSFCQWWSSVTLWNHTTVYTVLICFIPLRQSYFVTQMPVSWQRTVCVTGRSRCKLKGIAEYPRMFPNRYVVALLSEMPLIGTCACCPSYYCLAVCLSIFFKYIFQDINTYTQFFLSILTKDEFLKSNVWMITRWRLTVFQVKYSIIYIYTI